MQTFTQIQNDIFFAEEALCKAKNGKAWCHEIVEEAMIECNHTLRTEKECLIEVLKETDFPLSRESIVEVFEYATIAFLNADIDACSPASREAIQEEIRRYQV